MDAIQGFWTSLQNGELIHLVGWWGYLVLALLVLVEGPSATLLGAAAASAGLMRPVPVFFSASAGNLAADILWYLLGYAGKAEWLLQRGRWVGLKRSHLERLRQGMRDHAPKILLLAKLTSSFSIPALVAAGLARAPWRRWFPLLFVGEMIWTGSLVLIGYYATEYIKQVGRGVEYLALALSVLFLLVILWLIRRALRQSDEFTELVGDDDNTSA